MVVDFFTGQLGHGYRVHLGWRRFAAAQQFAGVFALAAGTTKILAETACLQLHVRAALVTLNDRTVVALDLEAALLDFVTRAVRIVAAHMQLACAVDQIAVHAGVAQLAAMTLAQTAVLQRFGLFLVINIDGFFAGRQVDGCFAALFGRQCITRTSQEDTG